MVRIQTQCAVILNKFITWNFLSLLKHFVILGRDSDEHAMAQTRQTHIYGEDVIFDDFVPSKIINIFQWTIDIIDIQGHCSLWSLWCQIFMEPLSKILQNSMKYGVKFWEILIFLWLLTFDFCNNIHMPIKPW